MLETGFVQSLDSVRRKVVAIRDKSGNHSALTNVMDDVVQFRVHHWLAARDGDDGSAQISQLVQPSLDDVQRHWRRGMVILVAVTASEIVAAHGNQMGQYRMARGKQRSADEAGVPEF